MEGLRALQIRKCVHKPRNTSQTDVAYDARTNTQDMRCILIRSSAEYIRSINDGKIGNLLLAVGSLLAGYLAVRWTSSDDAGVTGTIGGSSRGRLYEAIHGCCSASAAVGRTSGSMVRSVSAK